MTQTLSSLKPAAPRIVGRYALYDAIASGGMASVHLGRLIGPAGFSRTVAVKRLHENFARDPEFVAMLLDEARLAARINHPNVVSTLDVVASGPELLIVMEYVAGESLAALIRTCQRTERPPPIAVVVDIAIGMLNGLHAAHEATGEGGQPLNIVHRDVSPQNVLVGSDGVTRVVDFGIAKAIGRTQETRAGAIKGKPSYMAPEQLQGAPPSRAGDVYSASVVLWEALTCERLFMGDNDATTVHHVLKNQVPTPSFIRSDTPGALDEIVLRGLRADPSKRWVTAQAMAEALEASTKPVARSAVANWVTEMAKDTLCERQALVSAVEGTAIPRPRRLPPPLPRVRSSPGNGSSAAAHAAGEVRVGAASLDPEPPGGGTRPTPAPISQTVSPAPRRATRTSFWVVLLAAAVAAAALTWTVTRVVHGPTAVTPVATRTQAPTAGAASQPPPPRPAPPEPSTAPTAEPPRPAISATTSAAAAAAPAPRRAAPAVKANVARPKAVRGDRIYRRD